MSVLDEVGAEVERQLTLWGEQNWPDGTGGIVDRSDMHRYKKLNREAVKNGTLVWRLILSEEVYEALAETDPNKLRTELIQVAAVATSWVQAIDRKLGK